MNQRIELACLWFAVIVTVLVSLMMQPAPESKHYVFKKCHEDVPYHKWQLTRYFQQNGSPTPQMLAEAVLATKSPRLMAAIATIETNGNHKIRAYGYKKAHDGAFGVNRKFWGKVSKSPVKQALQAEDVLEAFTDEAKGEIMTALSRYGGDSTDEYAGKVLAELQEVP